MALNRSWNRSRERGGQDESVRLAGALAEILGPDAMESLVNGVAALHQFGGQFYVAAKREMIPVVEGDNGQPPKKEHATLAYVFHYSSEPSPLLAVVEPDIEAPMPADVDADAPGTVEAIEEPVAAE